MTRWSNAGGPWGGGGRGAWGGRGDPEPPKGGEPRPEADLEALIRRLRMRWPRLSPGGGIGLRGVAILSMVMVAAWLASGFYTVKPEEQGVELVFGRLHEVTPAGLNYNFPAPIGEVFKPKVTAVNQVEVGFRAAAGGVKAASADLSAESLMLTGDENIIDVRFAVFWVIDDAAAFLFNVRDPESTVKNVAEAAMREVIGKSDFQFARTQGRGAIATQSRALIQSILDGYGSGIRITEVNVQQVDPPSAVIGAFRDVQAARADKERAINEATGYLNEITQRAQGQAEQILRNAEAYKGEQIARAEGDAARFVEVYQQYREAPDLTRRRLYLETMESVLGGMNKIIIENGSGVTPYLPLDQLTRRRAPSAPANDGSESARSEMKAPKEKGKEATP